MQAATGLYGRETSHEPSGLSVSDRRTSEQMLTEQKEPRMTRMARKTRKTRKTFVFTIETAVTPVATPTPPQGPWGVAWLVVRAAGVLASVAHLAVPHLLP